MLLVDLATNLIETKQQVTKRKSSLKSEAKTVGKTKLKYPFLLLRSQKTRIENNSIFEKNQLKSSTTIEILPLFL